MAIALNHMTEDWELRFTRSVCLRIKEAREATGMNRTAFARSLGMIGSAAERKYRNYELDRIPWKYLDQIAEATGRDVDWFLTGGETAPELSQIERELRELRRLLEDRGTTPDSGEGGS